MNRIATLLVAGAIAAIAVAPVVGYAQSRVYIPPKETKSQLGYRDISGLNWRTIAEHYAPAKGIDDWRRAIPARHWKEGYSAYQIAHAWQSANPKLPPEVAALFYGPVELLAAIPEHKTPLPGGRAPSQSDLLFFIRIQNRVCAVTVEGKNAEGFDQTVGEWSENASAGKVTRLKHITAKLGLAYPPAGELRYQLLHRAAAAIIEAERFNADCAAMVVQSFSPKHTGFDDFAEFLKLFGINSAKRDMLYETDMPGMTLYFGWASSAGTVATAPVKSEVQQPAVTATSAESVASTPSSQSSQTSPIMFVIGGVIVLALVGVVVFFAWQRSRENAGKAFESYVKSLLCGRENVKLTKPTDKFDYPDFEMTIRDEKRRISLECKWTKSFYQGNYNVIRDPKQLRKYEAYQKDYGQPFFIVLGVGGTGKKPHHLYTIPLEELPQTKLNYEQLKVYLQKEGDYVFKLPNWVIGRFLRGRISVFSLFLEWPL